MAKKLVPVPGAGKFKTWRLYLQKPSDRRRRKRTFLIQQHNPFKPGDEMPAEIVGEPGWIIAKIEQEQPLFVLRSEPE